MLQTILVEGGKIEAKNAVDGKDHVAKIRAVLFMDPAKIGSWADLAKAGQALEDALNKAVADKSFVDPASGKKVPFKGSPAGVDGAFNVKSATAMIERAFRIGHNGEIRKAVASLIKPAEGKPAAGKTRRTIDDINTQELA